MPRIQYLEQRSGIFHHGSRRGAGIVELSPLSHVGTLQAARDRLLRTTVHGVQPAIYEIELRIDRALVVPDLHQVNHSWLKLVDQLHYDIGFLTGDERGLVLDDAAPAGSNEEAGVRTLCGLLMGKGLDSLAYRNMHEDPGSWSFIVLYPGYSRILGVHPLEDERAPGP